MLSRRMMRRVVPTLHQIVMVSGSIPINRSGSDARARADLGDVHLPHADIFIVPATKDVAVAIVIEVAGTDNVPVGWLGRDAHTGQFLGAVHEPHPDIPIVPAPQDVAIAIV